MAGGRLDLRPILRGHWRGLTRGDTTTETPDWTTRLILLATLPLAVTAYGFKWTLSQPGPLLSGVALLAGALIGSFGTLSTLRLKLVDLTDPNDDAVAPERDLLDESVAHLLLAALVAALDAAALVIGTNTASVGMPVSGLWAAVAIGLSAYLFLLFVLILPRLYAAYVQINNVRPGLSGQVRRRRKSN